MSTLKYETFEEVENDTAVKEVLETDGRVWVEVVGIQFMIENNGTTVKIYKYGKDKWLFAGKYSKPVSV